MTDPTSPELRIGLAAVHEDGDAGLIAGFYGRRWRVVFCSGYEGNFPHASASDPSVFCWFPSGPRSESGPDLLDVEKLALLSALTARIDAERSSEARVLWSEASCSAWFPSKALDALIRAREGPRLALKWAEAGAAIRGSLAVFRVEAAKELYLQSDGPQWWPEAEFERELALATAMQRISEVLPVCSLHELDRLMQETVAAGFATADEMAYIKKEKVRLRIARAGLPLDEEQIAACARIERHRIIQARAGSGKTRTLAAYAALSIRDEALAADQVLILAFNKKAATEIGDRVRHATGITEFRNARTFHSLAWHLADHAGRDLLFDDGSLAPSRRKQSGFVERLVKAIMNPVIRERTYEFFRREVEQIDRLGSALPDSEYFAFRSAMRDYTLGGETVKSNGEKYIADFLFEHGIPYVYEKVWSWDRSDRVHGTAYRPDFSLAVGGQNIILEHWALDPRDPDARVPSWWDVSTEEYRNQIEAKRGFCRERGIRLLETDSGMLSNGRTTFEATLLQILSAAGIICRRLSHDELVRRVVEAPRSVSRLAELFLQFISRAKKRGWSAAEVSKLIGAAPDPDPRSRIFQELAVHAYAAYERQLVETCAMDFDDLLISATESVRATGGATRLLLGRSDSLALRDLRWILIDEFQDFSELYFQLIDAILDANPEVRIVAVGDDWQAINGFAGAQLAYFASFQHFFAGAGSARLSTNRRSGTAIVSIGNEVMKGWGEPARAYRGDGGHACIIAVDKVWTEAGSPYVEQATSVSADGRKSVNWELARALKACADFIAESAFTDPVQRHLWLPSVLILARTSRAYGTTLHDFGGRLERVLRQHSHLGAVANEIVVVTSARKASDEGTLIEVMTAHKAKGKEADTVIVLECVCGQFPKVHADNQLFRLFGVSPEDVLAEERRLFYVAATRAEYRIAFLTETKSESPYLGALKARRSAGRPNDAPLPELSEGVRALEAQLRSIDRNLFTQQNVSTEAVEMWALAGGLENPSVGYLLRDGLYAELAWPEQTPPVAILTGVHRAKRDAWCAEGWQVY